MKKEFTRISADVVAGVYFGEVDTDYAYLDYKMDFESFYEDLKTTETPITCLATVEQIEKIKAEYGISKG